MKTFTVSVYIDGHKETIKVEAQNQDAMKRRVKGMGYDRVGAIHNIR